MWIMKFRSFRNYYGFCVLNFIKYHWRFCRFQPQSEKLVTTLTVFPPLHSGIFAPTVPDETVFHVCPTSKFESDSESFTAAHFELEVILLLYKVLQQVSHQIHCEAI